MKNDIKLKNLKGTVDYLPTEQILRERVFSVMKNTFEKYGFMPLDSAILCPFELLASKYAGGAEILKEVYKLKDQGERELGLRYDLTVPFSKVIAGNQNLTLPFRRYEIGKVFRDGPVKLGRMREFYQCDVDVCGVNGRFVEVEFFLLTLEIFKKLSLDIEVKWNNRKYLSGIIELAGVEKSLVSKTILTIDKIEKVGKQQVEKELLDMGLTNSQIEDVFKFSKLDPSEIDACANETLKEGIEEVLELRALTKELGIDDRCIFSSTLARGLEIYTGTVWEIFDRTGKISSSLGGGGRYDKIIGKFIDDGNEYPAVGMSFGIEPIYVLLENGNKKSNIDVLIFAFDNNADVLKIATKLREKGLNVVVDYKNKKLKKSLDYANNERIPFVAILGEDEIKANKIMLKDMNNSTQNLISIEEIFDYIKK
ncbi:MAG: histidine--tRNA ligase [Firmicutes bacterium]|nr:histidine--tRNA ligase [Bacillota bacterium]MDY3658924.1 histidine--tRNA ligase [Eubacteriales bacterium]